MNTSTEKICILIVDDEKVIRDLCARALKNYRILQAESGVEAFHAYQREKIDLILTDVMMPGGSGLDLLKNVKEHDPNSLVVIMTGFADKEIILAALKDDADDFINKPLNLLQLRTSIEKVLKKRELKEEIANLKRLDRLKSNFLSMVSHKLRTPITGISLFLQNLEAGIYDSDDPAFKEYVRLIRDESSYLGRLVGDLLSFSEVMVGDDKLTMDYCDLGDIIQEALQSSVEAQSKEGIETRILSVDFPRVLADRKKLSFLIRQVVDNAYKFSGQSGTVSIAIEKNPEMIAICISDTGKGIPEEEIPKVFNRFYQIDPQNTGQIRGFGLGLYYAREFAKQHGGTISITSAKGSGTSVVISIPDSQAVMSP